MYRTHDNITETKTGDLIIKYNTETIEESKKDQLLVISEILFWNDCYFIGETFCLSNYETGHLVYNTYSDLIYIFAWSDLEKLEAGEAVTLYARKPDADDRELIESEGY